MLLPRLTLRLSRRSSSKWKVLREQVHLFRCGHWNQLYNDYVGSLHQAEPPQHQNDPLGICSRVEGLVKRGNLRKASAALSPSPAAPATIATLQQLELKHPQPQVGLPDWVHTYTTPTQFSCTAERYSPPDDPKKADVIVRDPDSGETWITDTTITDPVLQNRDPTARKPPGWATREAQKRKERDYYRHTEHVVFCALAVETYGANAPPTTAFLKLLATAAARNRFRANPLAKSAKKMACHFSQRWSVALQRSQANALHTKARAGIEAAHPQMAADPWPLHLGDILHTLDG
ncbi:unnamed protein product [Closterium sp. NIES-54]